MQKAGFLITRLILLFTGGAQNGISPITPKMNLTCPNSQFPVFKFLQLKGCEVLAHFLGSRPQDVELPNYQFSLGKEDRKSYLTIVEGNVPVNLNIMIVTSFVQSTKEEKRFFNLSFRLEVS